MFEIKDGKITLNKTKALTPKQIATINKIDSEIDRNRYIMSLMGLVKTQHYVPRIKARGIDVLSDKESGSILRQMKRLQRLNADHTPSNTALGQWVGVEIECFIPHQDGNVECNDDCNHDDYGNGDCCASGNWSENDAYAWLKAELTRAGVSRCTIKYDGSLNDDEGHGVEVTILFNSLYGFEPLQKLCSALTKAGCYVNKSCGLHVHLDARHLKPKQVRAIGNSIGNALPVIKWLVPKSRHDNTYCKLGVSAIRGRERYYAVNLTAFNKYKTIEIRLHSGTICASKIESWVTLLKIIGAAKLKTEIKTFQDLISIDGITESLVEYTDKRITELNSEAWTTLMSETIKTGAA
jgi:hypothetical protein